MLKELDISTNRLENLVSTIGLIPNLKNLMLGFNRLKTIPENIGLLKNLENLGEKMDSLR